MSNIYYMAYNHSGIRIKFRTLDDIIKEVRRLKQDISDWTVDIFHSDEYLCSWCLDDLIEEVYSHS